MAEHVREAESASSGAAVPPQHTVARSAETPEDHDIATPRPGGEKAEAGDASAERATRDRSAPRTPRSDEAPKLDKVDDASDDSFPASDAPAWTGMRIG